MERKYKINNSEIKICFGDILKTKTEVIVSSDDCLLSRGGGISKCISIAAGESLQQDTKKKVPASLGDVVVTTAGNLPQKFVFHAITIDKKYSICQYVLNQKQNNEVYQFIIKHSIRECFKLLAAHNIHSIAFPAIGAGAAGIPYEKVAQLMSEAISEVLLATNKHYEVEIYLYDRFEKMTELDFLPFFECFSYASKYSLDIEKRENKNVSNDYSKANMVDNAKKINMNHQVFISYSRKDTENIKPICSILNDLNIKYWLDVNGIYSGENYKDVICDAIKKAILVIFISSKNSNASSNVAKEISLADKFGKTIIPILLDKTPYAPRINYDLSSIDSIDYSDRDNNVLDKLRLTIQAKLVTVQDT
ncbi:macro domain-containing protein [Prevotella sp. HCN-7019]|uniref:macro domain-containing protein n=1 Tax=Prevotella sp. HCN-7019 TaxID=3134668 RepID=UPI0030BC1D49